MQIDCLTQLFIELMLHYYSFPDYSSDDDLVWGFTLCSETFSTFRKNESLLHCVKAPRRPVLFDIY